MKTADSLGLMPEWLVMHIILILYQSSAVFAVQYSQIYLFGDFSVEQLNITHRKFKSAYLQIIFL